MTDKNITPIVTDKNITPIVTDKNITPILTDFNSILESLSSVKIQITVIQNKTKQLEKLICKKIKQLEKEQKKIIKKVKKKPSGFAVPCSITSELCNFINKPVGTKIARTDITRYIINYIKENNLQNPKNRRFILPDEKLHKLLNLNTGDDVTYFNIQRYMNKHFIKE